MRGRHAWYRGSRVVIIHMLVDFPGHYAVFLVRNLHSGSTALVHSKDLVLSP